jgi:hypothetical protein
LPQKAQKPQTEKLGFEFYAPLVTEPRYSKFRAISGHEKDKICAKFSIASLSFPTSLWILWPARRPLEIGA